MQSKIFILGLFVLLCFGCKTTKKIEPIEPIAVGSCRIVGYIVSYTKPEYKAKATKPCEKYGCKAKVKIVEILGCNPAGSNTLKKGDIVPMEFTYSLGPTNAKDFPKLKKQFPGMTLYSVFKADVLPKRGGDDYAYIVGAYDVMKE